MRIDLCFQGWLRDVEIDSVYDTEAGKLYDLKPDKDNKGGLISEDIWLVDPEDGWRHEILSPAMLLAKLQAGTLTLSLARALDNAGHSNVEIHDIEETK